MQNRKKKLLLLIMLLLIAQATLSYLHIQPLDNQIAQDGLIFDLVTFVLIVIVLGIHMIFPAQPVKELVEAMRALSIGYKDRRLDTSRFKELDEVARVFNELAASLSDIHDPNLGPLKVRARALQQSAVEPTVTHAAALSKSMIELMDNESTIAPESILTSLAPQQSHTEAPRASSLTEQQIVDGWRSGAVKDHEQLYDIYQHAHQELRLGQLPTRQRFIKMLEQQRQQLITQSQCTDVLFEIVCQQEQLALQPHLIHST